MRIVVGAPIPERELIEDIREFGRAAARAATDTDEHLAELERELGQIVLVDVADEAEAERLCCELGDAVWRRHPEEPG